MLRVAISVTLLLAGALLLACGDDEDEPAPPSPPEEVEEEPEKEEEEEELARAPEAQTETFAERLEVPWEIVFLPNGSALVTERPGRVRRISPDGRLASDPVAEVSVAAAGEGGLLGMALDPDFEDNSFVYLYRTTQAGNEVVRFRWRDGELEEDAVILDGIPAAANHNAGRIRFGPDDRLYVPTGDAGRPELAQDPGSLVGKFLALESNSYRGDGGDPEMISRGHRNPQGFDWHPDTERLYATEHGPTGWDELNLVRPDANYGWPNAVGPDHQGFASPLTLYEETIAPAGGIFVHLPDSEWSGDFLFGALVGEHIRRVRFDGRDVEIDVPLFDGDFGRVRTVAEGPDGALYALTSNRDGRGSPGPDDDRIIRIIPPEG